MFTKKTCASSKRKAADDLNDTDCKTTPPPFFCHFKSVLKGVTTIYKVGDSKVLNNNTYYFCNCPNHCNRIKWYKFPASDCKGCKHWLDNKNKKEIEANQADGENDADNKNDDQDNNDDVNDVNADVLDPSNTSDPTVLLVSILNLLQDNPVARDLVADVLNAASDVK